MRTPLLIASTALTAALIAGCGENDPAPRPSPTPSPTASSTGRVAPPLPPAATAHTKAGAIAFVRHYIDLINYTQATGDTKPIHALEKPSCTSCASVRSHIAKTYSGGGWIRGGTLRITGLSALPGAARGGYNVDVAVTATPQTVRSADGSTSSNSGGSNILTVFLRPTTDGWDVTEWTRAK